MIEVGKQSILAGRVHNEPGPEKIHEILRQLRSAGFSQDVSITDEVKPGVGVPFGNQGGTAARYGCHGQLIGQAVDPVQEKVLLEIDVLDTEAFVFIPVELFPARGGNMFEDRVPGQRPPVQAGIESIIFLSRPDRVFRQKP